MGSDHASAGRPGESLRDRLTRAAVGVFCGLVALWAIKAWRTTPDGTLPDAAERSKARAAAEDHLDELTRPTAENAALWGVSDFRVYGFHWILHESLAGASEATPDGEGRYAVTIPCCCEGTLPGGGKADRHYAVTLRVSRRDDKTYAVDSAAAEPGRDASPLDRGRFWLLNAVVMPVKTFLVTLFVVFFYLIVSQVGEWLKAATWAGSGLLAYEAASRGTRYLGTVNSGYTSYLCWGSVWVTLLCLLGFYLACLLIAWGAERAVAALKKA
jgi:hypothetical protein